MSETPKKVRVDAVLREWPEAPMTHDKHAMDWEQMAQRIDERVQSGDAGASVAYITDEKLFAEPLGQIDGEGHNSAAAVKTVDPRVSKGETMTMPVDRERDRRSLQDLAKMAGATGAMTPPPPSMKAPVSSASGVQRAAEAKKDDSGIVDLAMAAQSDPGAAARAETTPLAKDGLFDDEPASIRPPPISSPLSSPLSSQALFQQPPPSIPPFSSGPASAPPASLGPISATAVPASGVPSTQASAMAAANVTPITAPTKKKGGAIALLLGGLVVASAVAAGGFFVIQQQRAKHAAELAALSTPPAPPPVVVAPPETKPAEASNAAPTDPAPEPSVDPNALPTATPDGKLALAPKGALKGAPPAPAKADKPAAAAKPEETAKLSQKDLPTAPTGPGGDLGAAMNKAVGADGKPVEATPAAGNTGPQFAAGTVPQKPSQGAVTGAIGAVLPSARACLGPDDAVSRASITFASAGNVSNVNVGGGAAGKPAEACIKSALSKAKVAPFAEPSYTMNITVRH